MFEFRWNFWNVEHIAGHGVTTDEAEYVSNHAAPPYPEYRGDDKWRVWGQTEVGRFIQGVYIIDPEGTLYVIHARPLEESEKHRYRRRKR